MSDELSQAICCNKKSTISLHIEEGKASSIDSYGWPALVVACRFGTADTVNLLLEGGAAVDCRDKWGHTPLMWASERGDIDIVRLLIKNGADINAVNNDGTTSLMLSSWNNKLAVVEILVYEGASLHISDKKGATVLTWSGSSCYPQINGLLRWVGAIK